MVSIPKIIRVMLGLVLGLSLSNAVIAGASERPGCAQGKGGPSDILKCDQELRQGVSTVKGDVLRVEGNNFLVQRSDGKEVRLHIDESTQMFGYVGPGERVEARIDKQGHALSIRLTK